MRRQLRRGPCVVVWSHFDDATLHAQCRLFAVKRPQAQANRCNAQNATDASWSWVRRWIIYQGTLACDSRRQSCWLGPIMQRKVTACARLRRLMTWRVVVAPVKIIWVHRPQLADTWPQVLVQNGARRDLLFDVTSATRSLIPNALLVRCTTHPRDLSIA